MLPLSAGAIASALLLSLALASPALANGVPEFLLDGSDAGPSIEVTMSEDSDPTPFEIDPLLTANDTDGDTAQIVWSVSMQGGHGTATVDGMGESPTTFTYEPQEDYNGTDSFEVTITDSDMNTDTIMVNVTIDPVNDAPEFTSGFGFAGQWGSAGTGDGEFSTPVAVAVDSAGNVYVVETSASRIQKFDSEGTFLMAWGSAGTGDGQFSGAWGIAVDASDNVYISDTSNRRIQKFDSTGNFLLAFGSLGTGDGQFYRPGGIAIAPSGTIYVVDDEIHRIQKFDASGTFLAEWGAAGSGDGQFQDPLDVALDASGNVYVAEYSNRRIQVFDSDGNFLRKFGSNGTGEGEFLAPWGLDIGPAGNLIVADINGNRVQFLDLMGNYLGEVGGAGDGDGQFNGPSGIAASSSGRVFVAEQSGNRVQYFEELAIGESLPVAMDEDGVPTPFTLELEAVDVESDTITWSISSDASHGTAEVSGTGDSKMIVYTPDADYNGMDSFEVHIEDDSEASNTVTINVTIDPQNDAPVITQGDTALEVTMDEDGAPTAFVAPALDATDIEDDTLTWSVSAAAGHGTATVEGMGASPTTFTYTPDADYNGTDSFTIQVDDGNSGTDTIVVNVTINPQPEAPAATTNTGATVSEGGMVILLSTMLETTDADSTPAELTYTVADGPADGMLVLVSDTETAITSFTQEDINNTKVVYVHDGAENATDSFDFSVSDGTTTPATDTFVITVTPVDDIPTLFTSADPSVYTEDGDAIVVDPAIEVIDPDDGPMIDAARVAINAGYVLGQDTLAFTAMHDITGSFNTSIGVLSLEGAGTAAQYQEVMRSVVFSTSGVNDMQRSITFSLGDAVAFPDNGHFYRFETSAGISWTDAKTAASALRFFGLEGYLTTITSEAENTFVVDKLEGQGWMGATDESVEGTWRWVTGPEGLEESGAGRHFYTGQGNGSAVGGAYNNWANVEPNDFGSGEDYAHFLGSGQWNDYPLSLGSITGYVVEFGGLPEGLELHLVDTKAVDITLVNDAPVIAQGDGPLAVTMDEDGTPTAFVAPTVSATDEEGDTLTWSVSSDAGNGTATASGSGNVPESITYTPDANFNGMDSFTLQVADGNGGIDTIDINVTVTAQNDVPVITQGDGPLEVTMDEDGAPTAFEAPELSVEDPDAGDTLTWTLSEEASSGTAMVSGTGTSPEVHTYAPNMNFNGSASYTIEVSDGNGGVDSIAVNVTVTAQNDAPYFVSDGLTAETSAIFAGPGDEDGTLTTPRSIAVDSDGNCYVVDASRQDVQVFDASGAFLRKFGTGGFGAGQFSGPFGIAVDTNGNVYVCDLARDVVLKFDGTGTFLSEFGASGTEDGQFQDPRALAVDSAGNIYVSDSTRGDVQKFDAAGSFLLAIGTGDGEGSLATPAGVAVDSADNLYVLDQGQNMVKVYDASGTFLRSWGSGGTGDGQFQLVTSIAIDGLDKVYVADFSRDDIQVFSTDGAFLGKWESTAEGDGYFDRPNGLAATGDGTVYLLDTERNDIQVFGTVPPADLPGPVAVTMDEDGTPEDFMLMLSAVDPESDTITWSISTDGNHGTASVSGTGTDMDIAYTPDANFAGDDSFVVMIDDGNGGTDTMTVNVTINPQADAPVITQGDGPLEVTMDEDGSPRAFAAPALDATDADGDTLTWSIAVEPANGDAAVSGEGASPSTFTYVPEAEFNGTDSITVQVADGNGGTDTIVVNVTVAPVNDAPVLAAIGDQMVNEGGTLTFTLEATDVEGDELTFGTGDLPAGAMFDPETATFSWAPTFEQAGVYADIVFQVTDGGTPPLTDAETISITVADVNQTPAIETVEDQEVAEDTELTFMLAATDPDGDALAYTAENLPEGASFDTGTATFTWTPTYDDAGVYTDVTFFATDDGEPARTAAVSITITVTDVNRSPVLDAVGDREIAEGDLLTFTVTGSDPDEDTLTFSATGLPEGATFDAETATFNWQSESGDAGSYMVTITVTDDGEPALSAEETITIAVAESGDLRELLLAGFGEADANNDGLISREESTLLFPGLTQLQFDMLDTNEDGFLSEPELRGGEPAGGCFGTGPNDFFLLGFLVYLLAVWERIMRWSARLFGYDESTGPDTQDE